MTEPLMLKLLVTDPYLAPATGPYLQLTMAMEQYQNITTIRSYS